MKKTVIAFTALSALFCASLTGCTINVSDDTLSAAGEIAVSMLDDADIKVNGQQVDISLDSNGDINVNVAQTTAADQSAAAAAAPASSETTAAAAQTAAPESSGLSIAQMQEISKQLIQEYTALYDGLMTGGVATDFNDCYNPDSAYAYFRVTDPQYQSIDDLKAKIENTLSGTEFDRTVYNMFEGEHPIYLEAEGGLYALSVGRGSAYSDSWYWDALQFTNVTEYSFTVTGKYIHIGDTVITQSFDIVATQYGYRIGSVSEPEFT